jgi:hypothetical protein
MAVGLMLTSFGVFWLGEGLGLRWPLADVAIIWLAALYGGETLLFVTVLRRRKPRAGTTQADASFDAAPPSMAPADVAPADVAPADVAPADVAPASLPSDVVAR